MLNSITLFFILFVLWIFGAIFVGISPLFIFMGFIISTLITFLCWRLGIIRFKISFMILQFGFYKFIFSKISKNFFNVIKISFQFLNPKYKFEPVLDYIYFNKDNDSEIVLGVNLITFLAGTLCVAIKKKYIIVHSLNYTYFSPAEMYNISNKVGQVYDNTL